MSTKPEETRPEKRKKVAAKNTIRAALLHPICLAGSVITVSGLSASLVALGFDLWNGEDSSPYQGLLTFMLFPSVMMAGLSIVAIGLIFQRRRAKKQSLKNLPIGPPLDWHNPRHRVAFSASVFFSILFVFGSIIGATRAYHYTESTKFCGALCHEPMDPQAVAHANSPHANVPCVECHVGHEIKSYAEAKISGMRQVYQIATNSYHRPIRLPSEGSQKLAKNCLNCHWPSMLQESQMSNRTRFGYDAPNTERHIKMLLRNGGTRIPGEDPAIHWHAGLEGRIEYWFADEFAQEIARVAVRQESGSVTIYNRQLENKPVYKDSTVDGMTVQKMNCLTCHNRPAHNFKTPDELIDRALLRQDISSTLPFIKRVAIQAMIRDQKTKSAALSAIENDVLTFYQTNFPKVSTDRSSEIADSIKAIQNAYAESNFPSMSVTGSTYPNNIGHRAFPGCFRCHDGNLVDKAQNKIEDRCDLCHVFFEESRLDASLKEIPANASSLHPFQSHDHDKIACWSCHTGHDSPQEGCAECHEAESSSPTMNFACSTCHSPEQHAPSNSQCASCHPTEKSPMHALADHGDCTTCHEPHTWAPKSQDNCTSCHESQKCKEIQANDPEHRSCTQCHEFGGMSSTMRGLEVPWKKLRIAPQGHKKK